jgi:hypothetical protein
MKGRLVCDAIRVARRLMLHAAYQSIIPLPAGRALCTTQVAHQLVVCGWVASELCVQHGLHASSMRVCGCTLLLLCCAAHTFMSLGQRWYMAWLCVRQ